ncbi:tail fiber assembly protein [Cronobacter dublinensis]|uniref:tail fiber assembly protein n=1 Tax=Cronobacter dublinensis TaxID=413497 RepID=UPI0024AECCEF|nr:tail fiber assembly protein [Cronobacter dublinensis]ELY2854172.1 phage tail assembly chaperone [Cronobacter dublinensis]MDI7491667.1 tail fiber assembly protein [Cronobacter dublinensis]
MIKVNHARLAAIKSSEVRAERDMLIAASDWRMMPDAPGDKEVWKAYRDELRAITEQKGFPFEVIWPIQPGI